MENPLNSISEERLVELASTLVSIPSITNQEEEIADWAYERFRAMGLTGVRLFSGFWSCD